MSAIDAGTLQNLIDDMGGDREVVRELIQSFLEEAPKLLAAGRAARMAGDVQEVQRAYHTLKSNAATFGALALAGQAREIEQAARAGTLPAAAALDAVEQGYTQARGELLAFLA